ncbi:MAG: hypothetical protein HAW62_02300 [Endozoicomonadaceae bacterium]|nr:hypothetical protein [Endozoicomonadaceae bacterium]
MTDSGNYPMPENIQYIEAKHFNYYVPITNPIQCSEAELPESFINKSLIFINNNQLKVTGYNIIWPFYVAYHLKNPPKLYRNNVYKLCSYQEIQYICQDPTKRLEDYSLNYAWVGAVTGHPNNSLTEGCYQCSSYPNQPLVLSLEELIKKNQQYMIDTSKDYNFDRNNRFKYRSLAIPDLNKQVSMYLADTYNAVTKNVGFFIWIGGNDIAWMLSKTPLYLASSFCKNSSIIKIWKRKIEIVCEHIQQAILKIKTKYHSLEENYTIHLMTIPDITHFPTTNHIIFKYSHYIPSLSQKMRYYIQQLTQLYNEALKTRFTDDKNIKIIDLGQKIDLLAKSVQYKEHMTTNKSYIDYLLEIKNKSNPWDTYNRDHNRFFTWNHSHLSASMHKHIGMYIINQLENPS